MIHPDDDLAKREEKPPVVPEKGKGVHPNEVDLAEREVKPPGIQETQEYHKVNHPVDDLPEEREEVSPGIQEKRENHKLVQPEDDLAEREEAESPGVHEYRKELHPYAVLAKRKKPPVVPENRKAIQPEQHLAQGKKAPPAIGEEYEERMPPDSIQPGDSGSRVPWKRWNDSSPDEGMWEDVRPLPVYCPPARCCRDSCIGPCSP